MDVDSPKAQIAEIIENLEAGDVGVAQTMLHALLDGAFKPTSAAATFQQAKYKLFSSLSHNIRTPVNTIVGYLELLAAEDLTNTQQDFVKEIRMASDTLQFQMNDLLDLSRMGNEKLPLEEIIYHVRALIEDTVLLHVPSAEKKMLELHVLVNADVPEKLIGDPGRIRQILNHLLDNAIQYTEAGEIVLEASTYSSDERQTGLLIRITDTGIGMTTAQVQALCAPVSHVITSAVSDDVKLQIGVAMSKGLIEQMQGELQIKSLLGSGSTFQFNILQNNAHGIIEIALPSHDILRDKCVMLVGESKTQQEIMRLYLSQVGMIVKQTETPLAALRALDRQFDGHLTADAIVLDNQLHNANVASFPEHLRKQLATRTPPILLVTSVANKGDSKTALENGFKGYIAKPIRRLDLLDSLSLLFADDYPLQKNERQPLITRHSISDLRHAHRDRILLADENKSNQKLVQMMLHRLGIDCDIAQSGSEAFDAMVRYSYQLVLLNFQTAGDGQSTVSAIRKLQKEQAQVPIVAMLSSAASGERDVCLESGINDILVRPITMHVLQEVITRYIPLPAEH